MSDKRNVLNTMFVFSIVVHILLGAAWSAHRLYTAQNAAAPTLQIFAVLKPAFVPDVTSPLTASSAPTNDSVSVPADTTLGKKSLGDLVHSANLQKIVLPTLSAKPPNELNAATDAIVSVPMGPFQSEIDAKKAWINVAESVNYDLLRGISMDISQGEYRLPDELDTRVRAKGDLTIEYPLVAAAIGKEAVVYVLLLLDEQGRKASVQVIRGSPDFDDAVLQSLEKVEFRPAILKQVAVRSLLILEFEFRRDPPEVGSL
jgi:TonB family protein